MQNKIPVSNETLQNSIQSMIIEGRKRGLSDERIDEEIHQKYGVLDHKICAAVDRAIFGYGGYGYWRVAFGYPNNGDVISVMGNVMRCAFFTFEVETEYDRVVNEQYTREMMLVQD